MGGRWATGQCSATHTRLALLAELMADLHLLRRGAAISLAAVGEPVLYVRVRSGRRMLGVIAIQETDGWSYLWDGVNRVPVSDHWRAAQRITAVER
jgi:hypothetical protein